MAPMMMSAMLPPMVTAGHLLSSRMEIQGHRLPVGITRSG
jgi:hypothetical protein